MKMRKKMMLVVGAALVVSCGGNSSKIGGEYSEQIDALVAKMTLEEKIGQLNLISDPYMSTGASQSVEHNGNIDDLVRSGKVGNFLNLLGAENTGRLQKIATEESRLGIPLLFGFDVIHGYKTMFPIPLADAASFDREAMEMSAHYMSKEAAANGVNWTYAPMADISRDPRWGRIMEGSGEDVYLSSEATAARVRGIQGKSLADETSIAGCVKHFVGYGGAIAGRDYSAVEASERMLHEVYYPPFKAAIEAGVASAMTSFNTMNGEPVSGSRYYVHDVLREELGFDGFVVSDWASIAETMAHGSSNGTLEAAYNGLNATIDMDMCGNLYTEHVEELIESGKIKMSDIDDMVRRVLKAKFDLGLFDDPYKYSNVEREKSETLSEENLAASREVAKRSIVLMKNEGQVLPLAKKGLKIAVIGPLADDKDSPIGNWRGMAESNSAVSLLEGIRAAVGSDAEVVYAKGCDLVRNDDMNFFTQLEVEHSDISGFAEAVRVAKSADVVVMALGEVAYMSGECRSYGDISMKGLQGELLSAVKATGKPVVMALFTGRPLVLTDVVDSCDAILNCWLLGSESGSAIADVLFGDYNPSGKLPASFPYHLGQVPLTYSEMNTGRPYEPNSEGFSSKYRDIPNTPLFAFGYGLSYTNFKYEAMSLSAKEMTVKDALTVKVKVSNVGMYDGEEVVQLYLKDEFATGVSRPLLELKGFEKVLVKRGESVEVEFKLTSDDMAYYRLDGEFAPEAGSFVVSVGGASNNLPLSERFVLR